MPLVVGFGEMGRRKTPLPSHPFHSPPSDPHIPLLSAWWVLKFGIPVLEILIFDMLWLTPGLHDPLFIGIHIVGGAFVFVDEMLFLVLLIVVMKCNYF